MNAHITKRLVDSLKPSTCDRIKVYDDDLSGFGVIVYPSGSKSFFLEYGPAKGRRRMSLGAYGPLTVEAARAAALAKLADLATGVDPLDVKEAKAAIPTFGAWRDSYLEIVRRTKKQPRHDEQYLRPNHEPRKHAAKKKDGAPEHPIAIVIGRWSRRPIDQISRQDVQAAMLAIAERGHTTANRWLASVRACFAHAVKHGVIRDNPATTIDPFREAPPRARVLSDAEFSRVVALFDALPDPFERAAFVVLMDTGARKSEVLHARWEDFDLEGGLWRIPSPKAGRPQVVPLAEGTVAFLRQTERLGPWLVPGKNPTNHRKDLRNSWDAIREEAAIPDVTIHDLRRTFGLHVARRAGLHIASKLLRHSDIRVTEAVYAPLGMDELRAATNSNARERGKVIELAKVRQEGG